MKKLVVPEKAAEAHALIEREAKEKAVAEVRQIKAMDVGKVVRQGDIYIHCVDTAHPRGAKTENRQLAMGYSRGSRHVAAGGVQLFEGTKEPSWCMRGTFLGPLIVASESFTVTHPEHAHVELPAGTYQVTHQMDPRTVERVLD